MTPPADRPPMSRDELVAELREQAERMPQPEYHVLRDLLQRASDALSAPAHAPEPSQTDEERARLLKEAAANLFLSGDGLLADVVHGAARDLLEVPGRIASARNEGAEAEREACAAECDEWAGVFANPQRSVSEDERIGNVYGAQTCAGEIRARAAHRK